MSNSRSMLMQVAPKGIEYLTVLADNPPAELSFSADEIERFANAKEFSEVQDLLDCDGEQCLHVLLIYINWWVQVSQCFSLGREGEYGAKEFQHQIDSSITLLAGVLSAFADAQRVSMYFSRESASYEEQFLVLNRYGQFTKHIRLFAKQVWPEVDFEWLVNQP